MSTAQENPAKSGPQPLDEKTIAAVQRRIGIPARRSARNHNEVMSTDSFRHFAHAYGDDNPLYCEPEYARSSVWEGPIAPPLYPYTGGSFRKVTWTEEQASEMRGGDPLYGIGQYMCGERWIFVKPVRAGDLMEREQSLFSAELKASSFGGGEGALVSHRISWADPVGEPYAFRFLDYWHADRDKSKKSAKYSKLERTHYTDEEIERIDAMYAAETVRGASGLFVGEVKVGDSLGPIAKGPMAVTDIVCWQTGAGMGDFGVGALKLSYKNRQRVSGFYQKNEFGYWDAVMRGHWDQGWAERLGQPAPYDYGFMRTNWMAHLITNWMGDAAQIWKLSCSIKKFNNIGDWHEVSGVVTAVDPMTNTATVDVRGVNQRGTVTFDGQVVVVLPTTADAPATLPGYRAEDIPVATAP
jgi:acyl dehydratase